MTERKKRIIRADLPPLEYNHIADQQLEKDLQQAAQDYLQAKQDHRYADKNMILKCISLLLLGVLFYGLAIGSHNLLMFFLCYFMFMNIVLLLAVNIVHDASHNVFLKTPKANQWLNFWVTIPLGIDADCWRIRHTLQHHLFTNVELYDLDIDYNGFLRQTPFQPRHWFMRYQHYYWPFIAAMTFPAIIWCFDWQDRLGLKFNRAKFKSRGIQGWLLFIISKLLHLTITFFIPLYFLSYLNIWQMLLCYLFGQMLASAIFVVLILGTHWAKATFYQIPVNFSFPHGSVQHTFNTSLNWRLRSSWLEYWLGGLNLHLTHHIYPGYSHRHYQALTPLMHDIASKHDIDSNDIDLKTFLILQNQFLKRMGRES